NQITLCKEYIASHFGDSELLIYEDEGFSGGTTDRPQFKLLMQDARLKRFDVLVCYRLDRISRNVADFSGLIDDLSKHEIAFVSIREQFDTSTPMGRAMMYIASVFAQLERETIAERIRDNMLQLAKTGRWLGGTTPTGFDSEEVTTTDPTGKNRKMFKLVVNEDIELARLIFTKFLALGSLTKVEEYLLLKNIKTPNGAQYSRSAIRNILTNPIYCTADEKAFLYFSNSYEVYASENDFVGTFGVTAYNKTIQKKNTSNKVRDASEWIVAVGLHEAIIPSADWIKVQGMIDGNKNKTFRKVRSINAVLSGLLRCQCGAYMRPKNGRMAKDGSQIFYYLCETKEKSKGQICNCKNLKGNDVDQAVIDYFKQPHQTNFKNKLDNDRLYTSSSKEHLEREIVELESKISENTIAIDNLVSNLKTATGTSASKYIIEQINTLDEQNANLKATLLSLKTQEESAISDTLTYDFYDSHFNYVSSTIDTLEPNQQRELLRTILEKVVWDGENLDIVLFGATSTKKH
ncbi:MAG: recombinase family protein, partial [Niameybacter sp.]